MSFDLSNLDLNNLNFIKHIECTWEQYSSQASPDPDTLYYIRNRNVIYKGTTKYSFYEDLANLETESKTSLVAAINEVNTKAASGGFIVSTEAISKTNLAATMTTPLLHYATKSNNTIIEAFLTFSFDNSSTATISRPAEVEVSISDGESTYKAACTITTTKVNGKYFRQSIDVKGIVLGAAKFISVYAYTDSENVIATEDSYILITEY